MSDGLHIWTVSSQLESGYTVSKWCASCKKWVGELDLAGLVAAGHGDKPPSSLGLKCKACRAPVALTIHPPKEPGGCVGPGRS